MTRIEVEGEIPLSSGKKLVLSDYSAEPTATSNLRLADCDNDLQWQAELPESADLYVSAEHDGRIWATSYGGFRVELDPLTGSILSSRFVK